MALYNLVCDEYGCNKSITRACEHCKLSFCEDHADLTIHRCPLCHRLMNKVYAATLRKRAKILNEVSQ